MTEIITSIDRQRILVLLDDRPVTDDDVRRVVQGVREALKVLKFAGPPRSLPRSHPPDAA